MKKFIYLLSAIIILHACSKSKEDLGATIPNTANIGLRESIIDKYLQSGILDEYNASQFGNLNLDSIIVQHFDSGISCVSIFAQNSSDSITQALSGYYIDRDPSVFYSYFMTAHRYYTSSANSFDGNVRFSLPTGELRITYEFKNNTLVNMGYGDEDPGACSCCFTGCMKAVAQNVWWLNYFNPFYIGTVGAAACCGIYVGTGCGGDPCY